MYRVNVNKSPVRNEEKKKILPADVCLNFSLFFFLHFQGLKILPRLANLLLLRMGGVWVPGTRESERIAASLSTSSACFSREKDGNKERKKKVLKWEPHRWPTFSMVTDNRNHMTEVPFFFLPVGMEVILPCATGWGQTAKP